MPGNLYQLKTNAPVGAIVSFNGIHDKYGQVMKHQSSGYHLIRGLGMESPRESVHYTAEISR